jgi:hypothetical protein
VVIVSCAKPDRSFHEGCGVSYFVALCLRREQKQKTFASCGEAAAGKGKKYFLRAPQLLLVRLASYQRCIEINGSPKMLQRRNREH